MGFLVVSGPRGRAMWIHLPLRSHPEISLSLCDGECERQAWFADSTTGIAPLPRQLELDPVVLDYGPVDFPARYEFVLDLDGAHLLEEEDELVQVGDVDPGPLGQFVHGT